MQHKKLIPFFLILMILLFIVPTSALLIQNKVGNWNITTPTEIKAYSNSTLSVIDYTYNLTGSSFTEIANFTHYHVNSPSWTQWSQLTERVYIGMSITDNTGNISYLGAFSIYGSEDLRGLEYFLSSIYYPDRNNSSLHANQQIGYSTTNWTCAIGFIIQGNVLEELATSYDAEPSPIFGKNGYPVYEQNFTLTNINIDNITITFGHIGDGWFDAQLIQVDTPLSTIWSYGFGYNLINQNTIPNLINMLPEPLKSIVIDVELILGFIFNIINWLIIVVLWIIPYTPYIGLIYFIDVCYTSYKEMSFKPIGNMFFEVYGALVMIAGMLSYIGTFIWQIAQTTISTIGQIVEFLGITALIA